MFGYSLTRPVHNQGYYYGIFDACEKFKCDIEGWHTESGPGVYEAALAFGEIRDMADRAGLFKYVWSFPCVKTILTVSQIRCKISRNKVRHNTVLHGKTTTRPTR
jgi:hypothetical protein